MKSITADKQQKRARRFSLKWKWALGAAFGVFIVFAIFSILIFNCFTAIMLGQEQTNLRDTMTLVVERLNNQSDTLTHATVLPYLRPDLATPADEVPKSDQNAKKNIYTDSIIVKLAREDVTVSVYNPNGKSIFASRNIPTKFKKTANIDIERTKIHGVNGFIGRRPIRSRTTGKIIGYAQVTTQLGTLRKDQNQLLKAFFGIGLLAFLISGLVGYLLASYFMRPIKSMTDTIDIIKNDPQSAERIPQVKRNDELADLANLFNDMLDRMQRYIEQQEEFVEDVSHELRTPVAIIEGHLQMLNRWGKDDPEVLAESISASVQEITRMKSLVQEMLDLTRAEQVEVHYPHAKTDVKDVTQQVFNNFKLIHPDFTFTLDDDLDQPTIVKIYRDHFEQIMIILMDNAVKYSEKRQEVHLSIARTGNQVEIAVQDFGEGIAEADLARVFNRFYRVDKARSRDKGGNGLGLSIAQRLVDSYHGKISAESVLGSGTILRMSFPILNTLPKGESPIATTDDSK
ncbi:two-component sensor histidine kinase [Loigolactobacillus backii]|uniref:HAMP domain-containing sensor histidine kinase n=1 Tax=Loigolactobacillus backii TaxID=375175 RepID=UPI0007F10A65|nr:HAMP domain-containing histidine kinase [Loigolactobacillus backii]ANK59316.1 two-component sensor histidine kinase [Loigolactobacillus backii]ANK64308.1 two-component sensor histidine kinase [Loigolactobacillus backii]ANK67297.1 two-component sensor histidine kinase [Loigolactobacillus backii]OLF69774.1 histidine kinase [Loigolactobacillus backii]PIO88022.1 sensor histidine kinase [Loigolactobacillus backii]